MSPEVRCLQRLESKGFLMQFAVADSKLRCLQTGKSYDPSEISVVNFYRFEGISDPDDMSIIYAIKTSDGQKGTMIDAFGIYSNAGVGQFFDKIIKIEKQTKRGWNVGKC